MVVELRPHQQKAVDELANGKILYGGVGTGKSITAMAYYFTKVCKGVVGDLGSMRTPKDVYVITTAKKRDDLDWEKEAIRFGISTDPESSPSCVKLTVDSWNNIGKYTHVRDAFFIFDEQRLVGAGSWTKAFIHIAKSNEWILLSATPGDTWLDYIPVFVANGFYRNRTEFKREHVVYNTFSKFPKVDRYISVGKLVRHRNALLVHMPYERHTIRIPQDVHVEHNKELFEKVVKKRWHVYENRPLRDVAELFSVMRKVVNSDESRLSAIRSLMETHPRLIVFYNFDYELEQLRQLKDDCWDLALDYPGETYEVKEFSPSLLRMEMAGKRSATWMSEGSDDPLETPNSQMALSSSSKIQEDGRFDPLEGTIWEEGWSEEEAFRKANPLMPGLESSSAIDSNRGRNGGSNTSTVEVESEVSRRDRDQQSFAVAEWNGHKHEQIPKTDRWIYLVQYAAGSEGWNCIDTDAIVFYSQTYSYKHHEQAHGRIDRLNTPFTNLYYYYLISDAVIDKAVRKALKSKKNFNESSFRP